MDPQSPDNYYPQIEIERNANPNRFYAFPLFGLLVKIIMVIPVFLELWVLFIATEVLVFLINPFVVLITGKYLKVAFDLATGAMKLGAKISFFIFGVTDKYPGFSISTTPFTWNLAYPDSSSRLFAIPILGILIRIILIIPFALFTQVVNYASNLAVFFIITPLWVLIKGSYPETAHELVVDATRLSNASMAYMFGLSDKYPSFKISWNHKTMKIILMIIGVIALLSNLVTGFSSSPKTQTLPNFPNPTINQTDLPAARSF